MKKEQIKEVLGKAGKATLPALMLLGRMWNANAAVPPATELEIRAKESELTKPAIELQTNDNENEDSLRLIQFGGSCNNGCSGMCEHGCTGCTGCSGCGGECSSGCTGGCSGMCTGCTGCTGCGGVCSNGCTGCTGTCTGCGGYF